MAPSAAPIRAAWRPLVTQREWATIARLFVEDDGALAQLHELLEERSPAVRRLLLLHLRRVAGARPELEPLAMIGYALIDATHDAMLRSAEDRAREDLREIPGAFASPATVTRLS